MMKTYKKKGLKKLILALVLLVVSQVLSSCTGSADSEKTAVLIYYLNSSRTALETEVADSGEEITVEHLLNRLRVGNAASGFVAPLEGISVLDTVVDEGCLYLELGKEYEALKGIREVFSRAAIVKTLVQVEGVESVEFKVGGNFLSDRYGMPIGPMDEDSFVDYSATSIKRRTEEYTVYYANAEGTGLIREVNSVSPDTTASKEQAVIRAMVQSPDEPGARPAISPGINIINITTSNGICYMDTDMSFYDQSSDVPISLSVYAIVNSLCELEGVHRVQFSVIDTGAENSDTAISISGMYEPDYSYMENDKEVN